jgi:phage protein U
MDKVRTFTGLERGLSVRWAKHDLIGQKPVLEFVGGELNSVSFKMRFDISLGIAPKDGMDRLRRIMEDKLYKTLIIGGENLGRYVIESITEERRYHAGDGLCLVAEATVSLTEWAG